MPSGADVTGGGRAIRIRHREYLGEVTTGATIGEFTLQSFRINPADIATFPWLSSIACQFDQYQANGLIFEFISTAVDASTASASLGSVVMATDYDVLDQAFVSKQQMLQAAYSQEGKTSENQIHGIECDPGELQRTVFYTRQFSSSTAVSFGPRDYDVGIFSIAVQGGGLPANQSIGSLYVHYDFTLLKPQMFGGVAAKQTLFENRTRALANWTIASQYVTWNVWANSSSTEGYDLGITPSSAVSGASVRWDIPRAFQGAYILIEYFWNFGVEASWTLTNSLVVASGCQALWPNTDPNNAIVPLTFVGKSPNPFIYSCPELDNIGCANRYARLMVKVDDVVTAPVFFQYAEPMNTYPFVATTNSSVTIRVRIVAKAEAMIGFTGFV